MSENHVELSSYRGHHSHLFERAKKRELRIARKITRTLTRLENFSNKRSEMKPEYSLKVKSEGTGLFARIDAIIARLEIRLERLRKRLQKIRDRISILQLPSGDEISLEDESVLEPRPSQDVPTAAPTAVNPEISDIKPTAPSSPPKEEENNLEPDRPAIIVTWSNPLEETPAVIPPREEDSPPELPSDITPPRTETPEPEVSASESCDSIEWDLLIAESRTDQTLSCNESRKDARLESDPYHAGVWTSDSFVGNRCRKFRRGILTSYLDSTDGGFDTAVTFYNPTRIDALAPTLNVSAKIDINFEGDGNYWVGPKLDTRPCASSNDCSNYVSGWFENYVVENASRTPAEYDERLRSSGEYLGETTQDGSTYKHYTKKHKDWNQMWAIRQTYRTQGSVDVASILHYWRTNNLPNNYLVSLRANLETSGTLCGSVTISSVIMPTNGWE